MRALQNKRAAWVALFILFQLGLAHIISLLYYYQSGVYPRTLESQLFTLIYWFGHLGFLSFIWFLVLWLPARFFAQSVHARRLISFLSTFLLVLLVVDSFVYSQYRFHINAVVLDLFFRGQGQIISFSTTTWVMAYSFLFSLWFLNLFIAEKIWGNIEVLKTKPVLSRAIIFYIVMFFIGHVFHAFADAQYNSAVTRMAGVLPLSEPLKAKSLFTKLGLVDLEEYKKRKLLKKSFADSEMVYPLNPLSIEVEVEKPMNVMWLVVDSLRADMLTPEVMPNTYALGQHSIVFKNHFSNSNSTRHGIFGLFYGLPGAYFEPALRSQTPPVFVHQLVQEEYDMYVYANAPLTKPEFDQTVFVDVKDLRKFSKSKTVHDRDIEITDLLIGSLKDRKSNKPFFSFLFYDAPHGYSYPAHYKKPFHVSSDHFNYLALNVNSDPTQVRAIYKNSVHFVDSLIGQVLEALKAKNLLENTIILVTGDHGQEFNDTKLGYWGHNSNYSKYQTHVPMIIYWPGKKAQEISYMTSHFDVSTTFMLEYFHVTNPSADFSSGFNLFDSKERKWILMGREGDYAVFQKDQIIVVSPTGDYELLDQSYRPIDRSQMRTDYVQEALREMSRFLAK